MSSASPPKEPEAEPVTQSGDEADHMEREQQDLPAHGQGEFEVKEQDRWLPIANGSSLSPLPSSLWLSIHYALYNFLTAPGHRYATILPTFYNV